jgi:hypothetical protein
MYISCVVYCFDYQIMCVGETTFSFSCFHEEGYLHVWGNLKPIHLWMINFSSSVKQNGKVCGASRSACFKILKP